MSTTSNMQSRLDRLRPDLVQGWAFSESEPEHPVNVSLFVNQELLSSQQTSIHRKGLLEKGRHPTGNCGFRFRLNDSLKHGDEVSVRITDTEQELHGSPRTVEMEVEAVTLEKPVFFMHIAKTGGTTINDWLTAHLGQDRSRPHVEGSSVLSEPDQLEQYDFVSGHVRIQRFERVESSEEFLKATLLRDPLNHLASHLAWVKRVGSDQTSKFFKSHSPEVQGLAADLQHVDFGDTKALKELLERDNAEQLNLFDNCQLRYFLSGQVQGRIGPEHLNEALATMSDMDLVGCMERMGDFMNDLAKLVGLAIPPLHEKKNKHSERYNLNINDAETIRVLLPYVIYDMVLYERVKHQNQQRES